MNHKHTPGPWQCTYTSNHAHDYRLFDGQGMPLVLKVVANDHSEQRANARLISAAPELLKALKDARECITYCRRVHPDPQKGTGYPIEAIFDALIARIES